MNAAAKCFFDRMAQTLGQMLRRSADGKLVTVATLELHSASQRIIFRSSLRFVPQQLFNLLTVGAEKSAIEKDKSARFARALLLAGGAKRSPGMAPIFVSFVRRG